MRIPGRLRAILPLAVVVVGGLLALPGVTLGSHRPTVEQVVSVATSETWNMSCASGGGSVECSAADFDGTWYERAGIRPGSGSLTDLDTSVTVFAAPLDPYFQGWHSALQGVACAPDDITARQLATFVAEVANRREAGDVSPLTIAGECSLTGGLRILFGDSGTQYTYWIRSVVLMPPTPTPSPTPTLSPRPTPTASPTPKATPGASAPTATPSAATTPATSATPSPSLSGTPPGSSVSTGSPTASVSPSATGSPSPTPEQQVAGGNPSPTPPPGDQAPRGPAPSAVQPGALANGVLGPSGISTDPGALAMSGLLAVVLLLFMAFAGELFNSTLESNYDEVTGWFVGAGRPLAALGRAWHGPAGVVAFLAAGALVYAVLDPSFQLSVGSLATYLGMLAGLVLVLISFELPPLLLYRGRTGELPGLRALPWTLPAAVACVLISRLADLQPGYLYGILLGLVFRRELGAGEEGRHAAAGALWTLIVALAAWAGLDLVRSGGPVSGFGPVLAETALAVTVVAGLEAVALGLLPMRFLAGASVYAWNRVAWGALLAASLFAFLHLLIGPQVGYLAELDPAGLVAACGVFAAFGGISVAFWSYFRFRPARAPG